MSLDAPADAATPVPATEAEARPRRLPSLLLGVAVLALIVVQAIPELTDGDPTPAGLDARHAPEWTIALEAVALGREVLQQQDAYRGRHGAWVTDPAHFDDLELRSPWPEDVVCAGLGPREASDGESAAAGWRMVLTSRAREHWCLHYTDQGLDRKSSHVPPWMAEHLPLDG